MRTVVDYLGLVHQQARIAQFRLPRSIDYEDLVSEGLVAVARALKDFKSPRSYRGQVNTSYIYRYIQRHYITMQQSTNRYKRQGPIPLSLDQIPTDHRLSPQAHCNGFQVVELELTAKRIVRNLTPLGQLIFRYLVDPPSKVERIALERVKHSRVGHAIVTQADVRRLFVEYLGISIHRYRKEFRNIQNGVRLELELTSNPKRRSVMCQPPKPPVGQDELEGSSEPEPEVELEGTPDPPEEVPEGTPAKPAAKPTRKRKPAKKPQTETPVERKQPSKKKDKPKEKTKEKAERRPSDVIAKEKALRKVRRNALAKKIPYSKEALDKLSRRNILTIGGILGVKDMFGMGTTSNVVKAILKKQTKGKK